MIAVRDAAVERWQRLGHPSVKALIAAFKNPIRMCVVVRLRRWARLATRGPVEPLSAALKDSRKSVREAAAEALGNIGDARAVEQLSAALKDSYRDVRYAALRRCAIGTPAVEALITALKDSIGMCLGGRLRRCALLAMYGRGAVDRCPQGL